MENNIHQLLDNEEKRQLAFPITKQQIYLAHAGVSPLPLFASEAITQLANQSTLTHQEDILKKGFTRELRDLFLDLIDSKDHEVALIGPTSLGLSTVARGLKWSEGDNVIYYPGDYPSNAVLWRDLENFGIETRPIQCSTPGLITIDHLKALVDSKTKLVSLTSTHYISGAVIDLDQIGAWLHQQGILFCVDGIQSLGAIETSLKEVDFCAADSHKWLLGPCGAGVLYIHHRAYDQLHPPHLGWNNIVQQQYITPQENRFRSGGERFEAGTASWLGLVGMKASLQMMKSMGFQDVWDRITSHTRFIREALVQKDYEILSTGGVLSGITSFRKKGINLEDTFRDMMKKGIHLSLRSLSPDQPWLRASPHFYNTREELERFVSELP